MLSRAGSASLRLVAYTRPIPLIGMDYLPFFLPPSIGPLPSRCPRSLPRSSSIIIDILRQRSPTRSPTILWCGFALYRRPDHPGLVCPRSDYIYRR